MSALVYAVIGVLCVVDPVGMMAGVHLDGSDPIAGIEIRAMYGGLELGMALFLGWCVWRGQLQAGALAAALSIGGIGVARGLFWLLAGAPPSLHPYLLGAELPALVLGLVAFWRAHKG